ncbi:MAG: LytTR family DNA-binding domain-containing protein [Bacteroidales bacterium]|nr:LytTR family DNA-binding domain-containing protein [Bacteroidales bacterium]
MNCIIVDDEPLAREAVENLLELTPEITLIGTFSSAVQAQKFMTKNQVDLAFLDINMPGLTGIEFAKTISNQTLIIFTTAYSEYAIDSYEVDAIDYLVKPIEIERFKKAVKKAESYYLLLNQEEKENVKQINSDFFFVKSERKYLKINFSDILFVEGLKDYVVLQLSDQRIITHNTLKSMVSMLPQQLFMRVNKSYIINTQKITAFDNNDIFINDYEIAIGDSFRDDFFEKFVTKIRK